MLVPSAVMSTLENESLFNDASGIVALNLAIAAAVTGQFSLISGIGNFLYVFFGGIIAGGILGAIIVAIRLRLINMHVDAPSVMVPFTLLTPFVVYLLAEAIGVSGILAVVVTGLIHGIQQDRLRLTSSRLQIVMTSTWSVVSSLLNGIVFVLLGLSLQW
jgi:NhaP-type Na+/H+ and K+/H+ antiporters